MRISWSFSRYPNISPTNSHIMLSVGVKGSIRDGGKEVNKIKANGLITQRSSVQIWPPLPNKIRGYGICCNPLFAFISLPSNSN